MQQTSAKEAALNIFAILGFIALIVAGLWAFIQLMQVFLALAFNSSVTKTAQKALVPLGGISGPHVTLQMPTSPVLSGKPFAVGWSGSNVTNEGSISFSYACRAGLFLKVQAGQHTEYAIPCNAPFAIPKDAAALSLTAVVATNTKMEVPVTLTYTYGKDIAKDTATIQIDGRTPVVATKPEPVPQPKPTVAPTPTPAPVPQPVAAAPKPVAPKPAPVMVEKPVQKSNPQGFVELEARIVAVGKPAAKNTTSPRTSLLVKDTASVTFEIINNGTKAAQNWTYSLSLPTNPAYTYTSPAQPTLYAGSKATVTLSFDNLAVGNSQLVVTADPRNTVRDTVRTNNQAIATVNVR